MKMFPVLLASAVAASTVVAKDSYVMRGRILADDSSHYISKLKTKDTKNSYQMKHVRVIHARAQSDAPVWDETNQMFTSSFGADFPTKFRAALDTVNTASVEGGLMYVQAECINYNTRSAEERCKRKSGVNYMVFYDIVFAQTNETLALYESEYGPMLSMDGGRCTPSSTTNGTDTFPKECSYFNGDSGEPNLGPFIGGTSKETDGRAPYPGNYWYSYPHTCPMQKWGKTKTDECRAGTRNGLCDYDTLPNGVDCTYNYRILGYIPIDDVVGITSMQDSAGKNYQNFTMFCKDNKVEFNATEDGKWFDGIDFWKNPQDKAANVNRTKVMVDAYNKLAKGGSSSQVESSVVAKMKPLPAVDTLTDANPACYENVPSCASGCMRANYSQVCVACNKGDAGCKTAPDGFKFPTLVKAVGSNGKTGSGSISGDMLTPKTNNSTTAPTPAPTSASAFAVGWTIASAAATFALSFVMA